MLKEIAERHERIMGQKLSETPQKLSETPLKLSETPQKLSETPQKFSETPRELAEALQKLSEAPRGFWNVRGRRPLPRYDFLAVMDGWAEEIGCRPNIREPCGVLVFACA